MTPSASPPRPPPCHGRPDLRFSFETKRSAGLGVVLAFALVACGGAAAPTAPRGSTVSPAPTRAASAAGSATATAAAPTVAPATAPNPVTGTLEACALLTPAEVTAAYGDTLDTATKSSDTIYSYCQYTGDGGQLKTWVTQDPAAIPSVFGTMKINKGEAVSGVGDEAFWSEDSYAPGLYFLKGSALAYIEGSVFAPDSKIVDLGKLMATRM
jgi:hypothetical protein